MIRSTRSRGGAVLAAAVWSVVAAPHASAERALGLDVSAWQGEMSQETWTNIRNVENRRFVFIRASRGGTTGFYNQNDAGNTQGQNTLSQRYDDPYFVQNITRATNAGMYAGPYHFGRHDIVESTKNSGGIANTGTDEANHFLQMAGAWMRPGYMLPVFDLEGPNNRTNDQLAQFCLDFSNRIHAVTGVRPVMYINGTYATALQSASASLRNQVVAAYPTLWVARYAYQAPNYNSPEVQTAHPKDTAAAFYGPWDDAGEQHPWDFWQYASTGRLQSYNNGNNNLDFNVAQGGIEFVKDFLVPALWTTDAGGQWTSLSNWNSGQTPVAPVQGPGQVPRFGPMTLPATRLPGVDDTVILDRPNANITVTLASGAHDVRKLFVREALDITGGSLNVNYVPHPDSTPVSAQFSANVSMSGPATAFAAHTLLVDAGRTFTLNGGTVSLNTANLTRGAAPARIVVGGDVTFAPLGGGATATLAAVGSGTTPSLDLAGGTRTITVADGAAAVDLVVNVPINNGALVKDGGGTMRLGVANGFTGQVTVRRGTLLVTGANQLGGTGVVTTASADPAFGGTLQLSNNVTYNLPLRIGGAGAAGSSSTPPGPTGALDNLSGTNTWAGNIVLDGRGNNGGDPLLNQIGATAGTLVLSGAIANGAPADASWAKTGNGDVVLTGAAPNTYSGLTRLSGGRLIVEKDAALGAAGDPTAAAGNTFQLAGSQSTLAFRAPAGSAGLNYGTFEVINTEGTGAPGLGQIDNLGGHNTFAGSIALGGPTSGGSGGAQRATIGVSAGSLHVTGGLYARAAGATPRDITKLGPGRLILSGDSSADTANPNVPALVNSTMNVAAGVVELRAPSATATNLPGVTTWNVAAGAGLHLASGLFRTQTLNAAGDVTLAPGGGKLLRATAVNLTGAGTIDLADNKLIADAGPIGTATTPSGDGRLYDGIQGLVQRAKNGDAWNGNGLTSSVAAGTGGLTTIGVATGAQAKGGIGETETALWGGQTITGSSILAMYTYAGDANLDGAITGDDYSAIDFGILFEGMDGYANGDFNYDGVITGDDYSVIDLNILLQGQAFPISGSGASGAASPVTAVPEPVGLLSLAAIAPLLARRRRRSPQR